MMNKVLLVSRNLHLRVYDPDLKSDGLRRLDSAHTLPVKQGDDVSIEVDPGPSKSYTIAPTEDVIKSESLWVVETKIKSHFEVCRQVEIDLAS